MNIQKSIRKDRYQVFLLTCPATMPFSFAVHSWFVCNKKGKLSRWEVLLSKKRCKTSWGHLHLNFLPPSEGIEIIPYLSKFHWGEGKLIGYIEDNVAKRMIDFIEKSKKTYPYCYKYSVIGPNSNTYIQWIINNFITKLTLPWNAFGKNHKIK